MKKQSLLSKSDIVSFGVNFLAVVLGIVITFIGDGIISRRGEAKRAKDILSLMRDELTADIEGMKEFSDANKEQTYAINYLLAHRNDYKSIPFDSLYTYAILASSPRMIIMNNIAAELMQSNDFQNGIKDNKLKIAISEAYVNMDSAKETYNYHAQLTYDLLARAQNDRYRALVAPKDTLDREAIEALFFSPDGLFMLRQLNGRTVSSTIDTTIILVEKVINSFPLSN